MTNEQKLNLEAKMYISAIDWCDIAFKPFKWHSVAVSAEGFYNHGWLQLVKQFIQNMCILY